MRNQERKSVYKGDLIFFSGCGSLLIFFGALLYYFYFVSKAYEPPYLIKVMFALVGVSGRGKPWSQIMPEDVWFFVIMWLLLGIFLIFYGVYKYLKLKNG